MQEPQTNAGEPQEDQRQCQQCKQIKSLLEFPQPKGKNGGHKSVCCECERSNREERHRRLESHRNALQQLDLEENKRQDWERKVALRQVYEQRQREREAWYCQQPDRCCRACGQILPASAFGGTFSADGFTLHTRCKDCHEALQQYHRQPCCLCLEKTPRHDFLTHYDGYALCGNGVWLSLCCKQCESAFRVLPSSQQWAYIDACCQRAFPMGQVIYAEVDPETGEIRYVGRTGKPKRRHAQHLSDASPRAAQWGSEKKLWYTRSNWIYELAGKGLEPSMQILRQIEISHLVVEWEQRYIWHGIQQGWRLLNVETMDEVLVARVKASSLDFLTAPYELLVRHHFFSSHELVSFLHKCYQPERFSERVPSCQSVSSMYWAKWKIVAGDAFLWYSSVVEDYLFLR